jgi:hypothetical protein
MATLERRVQVLFDEELYERLLADAQAQRLSVGAYIREAVEEQLDRRRSDATTALQSLWDWADGHPLPAPTAAEWADQKDDALNRASLMGIE